MKKIMNLIPLTAILVSAAALILRVFQLLVVVDYSEMGFFSTEAGFFPCYGLYILYALAAVILIVGAVVDKKKEHEAFLFKASHLSSGQISALGFSFVAAAALKLIDLVFGFDFSLDYVGEAVIFIMFAIIGFILLSKKTVRVSAGYLQLLISISFTVKSAVLFMQDTIIVRVSDELILLMSYVMSVLFFLALGRFLSGNESKHSRGKLLVCGGMAAVMSLCASLAGYIAMLVDSKYMEGKMAMHPISQLGVSVIALAVIIILYCGDKSHADLTEIEPENEKDSTYLEI
ncbi:MAG: hypothetical protein K2N36_00740 [Ruminiclostridium sp.]|nr:hypothetical protein [Ruminiclostridium sp.]